MSRPVRFLVSALTLGSLLSGACLAAVKYLVSSEDPFAAYNHPAQPWLLNAHILIGPALIFVLGGLFATHVTRQLGNSGSGRRSGLMLIGSTAAMVVSGYLLQVGSTELFRAPLAWAHGLSGGWFVTSLVVHIARARFAKPALQARTDPHLGSSTAA